jgi:hypothetical protein
MADEQELEEGEEPEAPEDVRKVVGDVLEEKLPSILERLGFKPRGEGEEEPTPKATKAPRTARDVEDHWEERVREEVEKLLKGKQAAPSEPEKPAAEAAPEPPKTPWQERLWGGPKR